MQTENNSSDLFDSLKCPITYELFRDPVIGGDGHTYERKNITAWIKKHATSPITREPMSLSSLRPNYIVKKMVEDFVSSSLQKQYQFCLDVDVCKAKQRPIFQSPGKTIYDAKWMLKHGPPIVLIQIDGAKANREASFYVKLSCHPHIVRTYGLVNNNSPDSIMLAQEYAPEGDLSELLRGNHFQPTTEVLIEIFWQIVDAMICLADNQIIHGDLACRNVLVFRSSPNQPSEILVKLTDFGLTRTSPLFSVSDSPASCTMRVIPIRSAAPELLLNASPNDHSEKSDVYSFGVLMWEACSQGATPYGDLRAVDDVYREKLKGKVLERPNKMSSELWDIILTCTQHESYKRPNFKGVQEALLRLRFENKQESFNRTPPIHGNSTSEKIRKRTSTTSNPPDRTHGQYYNQQPSSKDSRCEKQTQFSLYQNVNKSSSDSDFSSESEISNSTNPNKSLRQYYSPCNYCSQSINTNDFYTHTEVCSVRHFIKSFAKMAAQLPPLEITSCQYCEHMIPLNMLNIHQSTCGKTPICPHNTFRISQQHQQPLTDSYVTFNYLKPLSLPNSQIINNVYDCATLPEAQIEKPTSSFAIQSEISDQSSMQPTSTTVKPAKPPKTGIRKALSSIKKKMTS